MGTDSSRRRFIKIVMGGSLLGSGFVIPTHWITPIVETVVLPAHAQTSPVTTNPPTTTPEPPPPPPAETGNVAITAILWQQTASSDPSELIDEYVEIENQDQVAIQMENWYLTDNNSAHKFVFPKHIIAPGETCRIFTHPPNEPNNTHPCEFTFGESNPVSSFSYIWNNPGDTASLYDGSNNLIDSCSYSSSASNPFQC